MQPLLAVTDHKNFKLFILTGDRFQRNSIVHLLCCFILQVVVVQRTSLLLASIPHLFVFAHLWADFADALHDIRAHELLPAIGLDYWLTLLTSCRRHCNLTIEKFLLLHSRLSEVSHLVWKKKNFHCSPLSSRSTFWRLLKTYNRVTVYTLFVQSGVPLPSSLNDVVNLGKGLPIV